MDIGVEYEGIKVKIPNVENIGKQKKKSADDKINEALEIFGVQREMNENEQKLYSEMLSKDEIVKEGVF